MARHEAVIPHTDGDITGQGQSVPEGSTMVVCISAHVLSHNKGKYPDLKTQMIMCIGAG